jgi:hypothetical protein
MKEFVRILHNFLQLCHLCDEVLLELAQKVPRRRRSVGCLLVLVSLHVSCRRSHVLYT